MKKFLLLCLFATFSPVVCVYLVFRWNDLHKFTTDTSQRCHEQFCEDKGQHDLFKSAMQSMQRERQALMLKSCASKMIKPANYKMYTNPNPSFPAFYYSSNYKVMFCELPKVGCTQFKLALLDMENILPNNYKTDEEIIHVVSLGKKTHLRDVGSVTTVKKMFDTFYKIMIVRDPFERLLSAYRDKLEPRENYRNSHYTPISERIRKHYHPNSPPGERASFEDFIDFLLDSNSKGLDLHWNLFTRLCDPCVYKYDYLARLETIEKDARFLRHVLGIDNDTSRKTPAMFFEGANDSKTKATTTRDIVKEAYSTVPINKVKLLYEMYKPDFEMFGYPYPSDVLGV